MYCKNCGKETDDKTDICSECRTKVLPKMPSKWWYALILFGIVGGIIGYILLKNKDKSMARNILVIGVGIYIVGLMLSIEQPKVKQSTDVQPSIRTDTNPKVQTDANIPTKTDVPSETGIITNIREDASGNNVKLYVQINNKELIKEYNKADTSGLGDIDRYIVAEIKGSYKDKKPIKMYYINGNEITTTGIVSGNNKIKIFSQPSNADVYIEDIYKGKTPLEVDPVSETYSLTVKLEGYQTIYSTIGPDTAEITLYLQIDNTKNNVPTTSSSSNEWNLIKTWSGKAIKDTETFHISGNEWRISWDTKPGEYGDMNFQIYVYKGNNLANVAANVIGQDKDSTIIRGSGDYYLSINTAQPYTITVEEKT